MTESSSEDTRRTYYDHEPAYRRVVAQGGTGWDDACPNPDDDSYMGLKDFITWLGEPRIAGLQVLELGCGGGQAALALARLGATVTGLDFAPSAIALAQANALVAGLAATFIVGDCLTLAGLADASFDIVLDNHVFHCVVGAADRAAFLASAARVLVPGGLLFSTTMSCEGDFDAARCRAEPATRVALNGTRYWASAAELEAELTRAGFTIAEQRRYPGGLSGDEIANFARRGSSVDNER